MMHKNKHWFQNIMHKCCIASEGYNMLLYEAIQSYSISVLNVYCSQQWVIGSFCFVLECKPAAQQLQRKRKRRNQHIKQLSSILPGCTILKCSALVCMHQLAFCSCSPSFNSRLPLYHALGDGSSLNSESQW